MTVLDRDDGLANSVMDDMLQYCDQNGVLLVRTLFSLLFAL